MSTGLDDVIVERIGFLKEQLMAEDDPAYIRTFQAQIKTLETVQLDRLTELIAVRQSDMKTCTNAIDSDRYLVELETLEWLQRQARNIK